MQRITKTNYPIVILMAAYLLVGIFVYKDYGISWDEERNRKNGLVSATYINTLLNPGSVKGQDVEDLRTWSDKDYGVLFELLLVGFEYILHLEDDQDIFQMRHLITFFMFWLGVVIFYFFILEVFNDWKLGVVGCLFLILSPRIFAHSFYNSKDIILLTFTIFAAYTLFRFLHSPKPVNAFLHALTTAAVIDIRIVGIYFVIITLFFFGSQVIASRKSGEPNKTYLGSLLIYCFGVISFTYMLWPFLWENPIDNFMYAFNSMSQFIRWDGKVLFFGKFIRATELPWIYVPVWMLITIPILYIVLFFSGAASVLINLVKHPSRLFTNSVERDELLIASLLITPLLAVIVLNSVLYDGWRQLFFIYPFFILISLIGIRQIIRLVKKIHNRNVCTLTASVLTVLSVICVSQILFFMIKNHPYQNVYFNQFAGRNISNNFELDYWGLSYKQALEYIIRSDQSDIIKINFANAPGISNLKMLPKKERDRITVEPINNATYYVSNFRFDKRQARFPYVNEVFSISVNDYVIMGVYKLRSLPGRGTTAQ